MLEFITGVLEAVGDFLGGLPASAWTVVGGAIGIGGTLLTGVVSRGAERRKAERDREFERADAFDTRKRAAYVQVIHLSHDLMKNTLYERELIHKDKKSLRKKKIRAVREITEKMATFEVAILHASLDSDSTTRELLDALHVAALEDMATAVSEKDREVRHEASSVLRSALHDFIEQVHDIYAPTDSPHPQ